MFSESHHGLPTKKKTGTPFFLMFCYIAFNSMFATHTPYSKDVRRKLFYSYLRLDLFRICSNWCRPLVVWFVCLLTSETWDSFNFCCPRSDTFTYSKFDLDFILWKFIIDFEQFFSPFTVVSLAFWFAQQRVHQLTFSTQSTLLRRLKGHLSIEENLDIIILR